MSAGKQPAHGAQLKHLASTYSHLFLRAADAFVIWDNAGTIHNANGATFLLTGFERDELIGSDHRQLFPGSLTPMLDDLLARAGEFEDGDILFEDEDTLLKPKTGSMIPVTLRFIAVHNPEGTSVLGIIHDIRDLKDLEARLAASQARYRGIVENVNDVIVLLDDDGNLLFINEPGEEAFGKKRDEIIGTSLKHYIPAEEQERFVGILGSLPSENNKVEAAPSLHLRDVAGNTREFSLSLSPLPPDGNRPGGILAVLHDITGQREIQEKLQYADRVKSIEDILSKITHEVKNPLAAINASAEFLRRHWEVSEEDKREVIDLIAEETNRINRIITEYLRIRSIPRPTMINYDIAEIARVVQKSLQQLLAEKAGITLKAEVQSTTFAFDADMVKQILWNFINNAIDAVGEKGTITVTGKALPAEKIYRIVVSDDGCGMDKELLRRAFDPFFTSKENGTGLGLAIVKMHTEAMGGSLRINSEVNKGTSIYLDLALKNEEEL